MQLTIKDSARRFVLKLTTVRREASRGLFATAELAGLTCVIGQNAVHVALRCDVILFPFK